MKTGGASLYILTLMSVVLWITITPELIISEDTDYE